MHLNGRLLFIDSQGCDWTKSTGESRRALYGRERNALLNQLRNVDPPLSEQEITRERLALEEAVRKVEAEAARRSLNPAPVKKEERHQPKEPIEYYAHLVEALKSLEKSTAEAHRAFYDRARKALLNYLRSVDPPLSEQEITRERLALEEAVRKVEAEAAARWKREEEARRKAEGERQPHVIRAGLAEAASPAPSLTPDGRLDAGPNSIYGTPAGDDNLPELPLRQRALIKTPRQTPAQVKVSLNNYDGIEKSAGDARRVFHEALLANLRSVEPALAEPDITCERLVLEKAIRKVETEAARRSRNSPEKAKRREEEQRRQREEEAKRRHESASRQSIPNLLRQGVIDEMSYRLFADGSIEVDMTHGTVRFQSIEELRQHLAKKGLVSIPRQSRGL